MNLSNMQIEILFSVMAIFFTVLVALFFNYMRVMIKKEKEPAPEPTPGQDSRTNKF